MVRPTKSELRLINGLDYPYILGLLRLIYFSNLFISIQIKAHAYKCHPVSFFWDPLGAFFFFLVITYKNIRSSRVESSGVEVKVNRTVEVDCSSLYHNCPA